MGRHSLDDTEFTDADRQPQDPDESFGLSDHTTELPPLLLVPYRTRDAAANPRSVARMTALRRDVAVHGIGNPLALFHDGDRAVLAEGNHRLAIAVEDAYALVPVRIIRLGSLAEVSWMEKCSAPISAELRPYLR